MDGASVTRLRWRLRGAWMWPAFIVLTLADGLTVHLLPVAGDRQSLASGWLLGAVLGLVAIVLATPLGGVALHRARRDMPRVVARNYAGAAAVVTVTAGLLAGGLVHHATIVADRHALRDAIARAQAFIGARAPAEFRSNLSSIDTFELEPPMIYRSCVTDRPGRRRYCVVVDRSKPFADSVRKAGSEPNEVLSQGTG
jgi:hypothetical protein